MQMHAFKTFKKWWERLTKSEERYKGLQMLESGSKNKLLEKFNGSGSIYNDKGIVDISGHDPAWGQSVGPTSSTSLRIPAAAPRIQ